MGFKNELNPNKSIFPQSMNNSGDPFHNPDRLFPPRTDSCELTIACRRDDYSASAIARAVEDADAHLLNLNITTDESGVDHVCVDLRVSHRNGGMVARSLERYGYRVTEIRGGYDNDLDLMRRRIDELMTQIEI